MSSSRGHELEFFYDISCPFAYIASTKIEALAARTGAKLIWRPVLLGAIYRATNAPQGAAGSASDVFNQAKKDVSSKAFRRTISRHGIPYNEPPKHPQKTTAALRLLYHAHRDERPALTHALFDAYWVRGENVSDKDVLISVVQRAGVTYPHQLVTDINKGAHESPKKRKALEESTDLAVKRGSPGVPAFWIKDEIWADRDGNKKEGRLYWGQDRLPFVEAVLTALNEGKNGGDLGELSTPLLNFVPRVTRGQIPAGAECKLEFWYDFSSPWAFLGWCRLEMLRREFGGKLQIEMKPFLLGILFRQIGAPDTPMSAVSEQKRNYSRLDHGDWVRWWNAVNQQDGKPDKDIEFYWADKFPIRTPTVLKAAIAEPALTALLFRACWERNLDMSSDEVLAKVISEAGYDAKKIMDQANSDAVKKDLRARTADAKEQGLCGVPTYRVFHRNAGSNADWKQTGDLVWGQDELNVVQDLICGWDGKGVAKVMERGRDSKL